MSSEGVLTSLVSEFYGKLYRGVKEIRGNLMFVEGIDDVGYDEVVRIMGSDGKLRYGRVLETGVGYAVVQVLGEKEGLQTDCLVQFTGTTFKIPVSEDVLGRMFNGRFEPIDGLPPVVSGERREITGAPINPVAREYPHDFIQTGISAIDGMLSLVRGQKLPIFSVSGLPHNTIAAQIARQATVRGKEEEFAVVFAGIGLRSAEAEYFIRELRESGAIERSVAILNLADDPAVERLMTPRIAMTVAEYLAFDLGMHVLVILTDMTNYCFDGGTEVILQDGSVVKIGELVEEVASKADEDYQPINVGGSLLLIKKSRLLSKQIPAILSWSRVDTRPGKLVAVERVLAPESLSGLGLDPGPSFL